MASHSTPTAAACYPSGSSSVLFDGSKWDIFGANATIVKNAKPDSWKIKPVPTTVAVLDYTADFTAAEFERISHGLIPREMEDKWFIFLEGNTLSFHRNWTGYCIYRVEFDRKGDNYSVRRATANRVRDEYNQTDDAYDSELVNFLIRNLLLGDCVPFPVPSDLPKNLPTGLYQHHWSGTAYPEKKSRQR